MRLGDTGSDDYLAGWTRGDWTAADGSTTEVADRVVAELEEQWTPSRLAAYLDDLGPGRILVNRLRTCSTAVSTARPSSSTAAWARCCRTAASTTAAPASSGTSSVPRRCARPRGVRRGRARASSPPTPSAAPVRGWQMHGLEDRVHELNEAAASIARVGGRRARRARRRRPRTHRRAARAAGHDGPADAQAIFAEQLRGLRDGGIDVVLIETMSDLAEVEAAVAAAREVVPDLPVRRDAVLRHQPAHHDGRPPRRGGHRARRGRRRRRRSELRPRSRGDGVHRRAARRGPTRGPAAASRSPTPGCRRSSATTSSTTRRPTTWPSTRARCTTLGIDLVGACCGSTPEHIAAIRDAVS